MGEEVMTEHELEPRIVGRYRRAAGALRDVAMELDVLVVIDGDASEEWRQYLYAHGEPVGRNLAPPELGGAGSALPLGRQSEVPGSLSRTRIRAVVGLSPLRWLAMEHRATSRTPERRCLRPTSPDSSTIGLTAFSRAKDQAGFVAGKAIGLDRELGATVVASNSHAVKSSGSGTTLAVATGHGHDATGIDLDPRNADLTRERVGPMLFEEVQL